MWIGFSRPKGNQTRTGAAYSTGLLTLQAMSPRIDKLTADTARPRESNTSFRMPLRRVEIWSDECAVPT